MTDHWDSGPAVPVGAPEDYPEPSPGPTARWDLLHAGGEPVGALVWNDGGASWTFASGVSLDAQEHGLEVQAYLRDHRAEGVPLAEALAGIKRAYAGGLDES